MDSKRFRVKRILLVFALMGIIGSSVIAVQATPTYNLSTVYSLFNTPTPAEMNVVGEANYTAPYKITVTPNLVFNGTTSNPYAILQFRNASDEGATSEVFELQVYSATNSLHLNVGTVDAVVDSVAQTKWTLATDIELRVAVDGIVINNGTTNTAYYFTTYDVNGLWTEGKVDSCTSGSLTVEFNDGGEYGLDIITAMVPVLITISVIGAVMKALTKFKMN